MLFRKCYLKRNDESLDFILESNVFEKVQNVVSKEILDRY